jgi:hypothetical protein
MRIELIKVNTGCIRKGKKQFWLTVKFGVGKKLQKNLIRNMKLQGYSAVLHKIFFCCSDL